MKMSNKFKKKAKLYEYLAKNFGCLFNDKDLEKQFIFESKGSIFYKNYYGICYCEDENSYGIGKKWLNWQITEWIIDLNTVPALFSYKEFKKDYANNPDMLEVLETAVKPNLK